MTTIDLNCDLGEEIMLNGLPVEPMIMPWISSVNISCGRHAGNEDTIKQTISLAMEHNVAIGAHPSYDDRKGFGRRYIAMSAKELKELMGEQLDRFMAIAENMEAKVHHFKPHGALYNAAAVQKEIAEVITEVLNETAPHLKLFAPPESILAATAREAGLAVIGEAFADRAYNDDGTLVERTREGAVISDIKQMVERCTLLARHQRVKTIGGNLINLQAGSICVHGDNPLALEFLKSLHKTFDSENINIAPPSEIP